MYRILRIICCIISALLLAGCVFFFVYLGNVWGIASIVGAAAFFALTILFKSLQEERQAKEALNKKQEPSVSALTDPESIAEEESETAPPPAEPDENKN